MKTNLNRGFTLIELLVVIAIIGILTAIILPNLNSSRTKAQIVSFKAEMDSVKKAAESFYSNDNTYTGLFSITGSPEVIDVANANDAVKGILTSLATRASDTTIYGLVSSTGDGYAVYGRLPTTDPTSLVAADIWCIDNLGKIGNPSADATTEFTTAVSQCW